jgi:hypothetical protein
MGEYQYKYIRGVAILDGNHNVTLHRSNNFSDAEENRLTSLFKQDNPLRTSFYLHLHAPSNEPPYRAIEIDNLALNPSGFPKLTTNLWRILNRIDAEHENHGTLNQITITKTWLLNNTALRKRFTEIAKRWGYKITPQGGALNEGEHLHIIAKALTKFKARARLDTNSKAEMNMAMKFLKPLKHAVANKDSDRLTKIISEMNVKLGASLTSILLPRTYRTFFLRPLNK